jgi:hypothetical protein
MTIDLQDQQFLTGAPHNNNKKEEFHIQEYLWGTNHDQNPVFRHCNQAGRRKKGQKIQTQSMQKVVVHNTKYLYDKSFLDQVANNRQQYELHQKDC